MATNRKKSNGAGGVHAQFGANLLERREALGMSQAELAAGVGCTRVNISQIEGGKQGVTLITFVAICRVVKCKPTAMLKGSC